MNEWWLSRHLKTMNEGLNERFSACSVVAAPLWHPTRTNSPRVCGTPWQGSPQIQIQVMYKYKYNGLGTVWQQQTPNTALVRAYLQQTQWEAGSGVNILSRNTIMSTPAPSWARSHKCFVGFSWQMRCRIFNNQRDDFSNKFLGAAAHGVASTTWAGWLHQSPDLKSKSPNFHKLPFLHHFVTYNFWPRCRYFPQNSPQK